ncbi:MAG TPA: thioredoxin domain-containing protein [Candidatus Dormibacteraeota bacterium]|jgi:protein-disulfide isomerase|nr:thioredoxin domain-containing protein [Candidatus Dormibacteraeota bacterium]
MSILTAAQTTPAAQNPVPAKEPLAAKPSAASKSVKAESVTINMPEGMTKDQADAILNELKAIHQLLLNPPATRTAAAAPTPAAPPSDKVKMSVGTGWYAMGRDDAPVTMVEFTDYQCPFCRRFEADSFAQLKKEYIDTGKVRFVSRDLPLDFHPNAPAAAMAARCAGDQHKFWEMRDAMMLDTATDLGPASILKYGQKTNLDMTAFNTCLSDKKYTEAIKKDTADAGTLGISGTPSFVIGKTDKNEIAGVRIVGAVPYAVFDSTIKDLLASK